MALGMWHHLDFNPKNHKAYETIAATAAVAGGAAVTAYLNAKYHLGRDLDMLLLMKRAQRDYAKAGSLSGLHYKRHKHNTGQLIPKRLQ